MTIKNIYVFGNPDVEIDSLPIKLLPKLREQFPEITFIILDPNEDWDIDKDMVIIDTVVGIEELTVFDNLSHFISAPRVSCHDFDAYSNLMFMKKLGKIDSTTIIGIPPSTLEDAPLNKLYESIKISNF